MLIRTIKKFYLKEKIIAAICSAVGILASAELLKGRKVTCFKDDVEFIKSSGGIVTNNPVEIDKKIITASGPDAAELFSKTLSDMILKQSR